MVTSEKKVIAVFGATGNQGGGVVRALKANGQFNVRALSRDPAKYKGTADEVVGVRRGVGGPRHTGRIGCMPAPPGWASTRRLTKNFP
jgi:nucleoside-diphosphate-sugar epimerase